MHWLNHFILFLVKDNNLIDPIIERAELHETVEFTCNSYGDTSWYYMRHETPVKIKGNFSTLTLRSVNIKNIGKYFCSGYYRASSTLSFLATATLHVYGKNVRQGKFTGKELIVSVSSPQYLTILKLNITTE